MSTSDRGTVESGYVFNSVLFYTTVGLGLGVAILLLSEFGTSPLEATELGVLAAERIEQLNTDLLPTAVLVTSVLVAIAAPMLGCVTGFLAASRIPRRNRAVAYSAAAAFVGSFVFALVVVSLCVAAFTDEATVLTQLEGVDVQGVVVNAVLVSLASTIPAAGTTYSASR
ncbi:hypothetical protein [Natrinema salaciae]|uniref:Uncharacterized protein n=1 Tax=Natrinema salaciae TaxID=1186196 RepID=A0A1H9CFC1_9EURY|nr:hypothetical protein [Natrinema salaciae]SEP99731.1 hypothetical protein SAMN04489841_1034 [Natrinema salaciae]